MEILTGKNIIKRLGGLKSELKRLGVKRIGLFGSFAEGTQGKRSDLDFIVKLERPTFDNYMDLKLLLENTYGKKVDLVMEESLKPALAHVKEVAKYAEIA